ncbi:MAG: nucleotide sugar dehydrogenase [Patescibacteria group bacterium]
MKQIEKISVCGLGKLGACIAATFAAAGHDVVGLDIDPEKVAKINAGQAPVDEPRLQEFVTSGHAHLRATTDAADLVHSDVTFFITPSPSLPDGSFSNEYLEKAMRSVARALRASGKKDHLFVCSSTTTPGSCESVLIPAIEEELEGKCGVDFGFCYNPEFIALGNVVNGLLEPDMVLIGESHAKYGEALETLYRSYNRNQPTIARMSLVSAELTKISVNSFVTMKISFTNQLRMIADQFPGANIHTILEALGSDTRIGKKYLRAGLSYGGPCFPRDNRLLAYVARQKGVVAPLAEATDQVNTMSNEDLQKKVEGMVPKGKGAIAVLGLTYKPDTHITEEAAGLILAQSLQKDGYDVLVHDFAANPRNNPAELEHLTYVEDLDELFERTDLALAVVCCPWPGYENLRFPESVQVLRGW